MSCIQRRFTKDGRQFLSPQESASINRRLKRIMEAKEDGEDVIWEDVAEDLGIDVNAISQRVTRIRRGEAQMEAPPEKCDCDEHGPCLAHFVESQQRRSG